MTFSQSQTQNQVTPVQSNTLPKNFIQLAQKQQPQQPQQQQQQAPPPLPPHQHQHQHQVAPIVNQSQQQQIAAWNYYHEQQQRNMAAVQQNVTAANYYQQLPMQGRHSYMEHEEATVYQNCQSVALEQHYGRSYARSPTRRPESPPPLRNYHQTMVLIPYNTESYAHFSSNEQPVHQYQRHNVLEYQQVC